jgi:hypothetical protein
LRENNTLSKFSETIKNQYNELNEKRHAFSNQIPPNEENDNENNEEKKNENDYF